MKKNRKKAFRLWGGGLLILIAAFLAAFLGQMLFTLMSDSPSLLPVDNLIIRSQSDSFQALKQSYNRIEEKESKGLVQILAIASGDEFIVQSEGFIATNDGWIIAATADLSTTEWTHVKVQSGEIFPIEKLELSVNLPIAFVKIDQSNLHSVALSAAPKTEILGWYLVSGFRFPGKYTQVYGRSLKSELYLNSDAHNSFLAATNGEKGQVLFNDKTEAIGLVVDNNEQGSLSIDMERINEELETFLRNDISTDEILGISYIDLAHHNFANNTVKGINAGAWVTNQYLTPQQTSALPRNSNAFKAGLRLDDIITTVEGESLTYEMSLSALAEKYKNQATIELGILRLGEEITIIVELTPA